MPTAYYRRRIERVVILGSAEAGPGEDLRGQLRPVCMETHVWIATKRYSPFQQCEERILGLEGETLTVRGEGGAVSMSLSEIELRFPRSMLGAGFELVMGGGKLYFWFYDPFTGRNAMLKGSDENEATIENAKGFVEGRRAAKPWLQALRAAA